MGGGTDKEKGGADAVAVMVEQIPARDGEPASVRVEWAGDARAMQFEADASGNLRRVYQSVDDGLAKLLVPGEDYGADGEGRTLAQITSPLASRVTNGIGYEKPTVHSTKDGEILNEEGKMVPAPKDHAIILRPKKSWMLLASDGFWEQFGST